jgi:hypothetical protein
MATDYWIVKVTRSGNISVMVGKTQVPEEMNQKHTTVGIRWWSPTQLLIYRSKAYVWQSGRDAQFSLVYGRMWRYHVLFNFILQN